MAQPDNKGGDARYFVTCYHTFLKHHHGKVKADPNRTVETKFHCEHFGAHRYIRTHHNHYISISPAKEVFISDKKHNFNITLLPDGRVTFKSSEYGLYLGVGKDGHCRAHGHVTEECKFQDKIWH